MRRRAQNLELLVLAAERLAPLLDRIVFLGGGLTGLLITDPGAPDIRATMDVDVIVSIDNRPDFAKLEKELRKLGFGSPVDKDAPICRWQHGELLVDVMPTDTRVLGFGNKWYEEAANHAVELALPGGRVVHHVTAPYFLATKMDAFEDRGKGDFMASHDLEDLIAVVDGRLELLEEMKTAPDKLRTFVANKLRKWLDDPRFLDALPGLILDPVPNAGRLGIVLARIRQLAGVNT